MESPTSRRGEPSSSDEGTALDHEHLARALSDLARGLQSETDVDTILADIVSAGVALIPGADDGSLIMVTRRRDVTSQHPTSELPREVDALQTELGQGPCLDAVYRQQTVRVADMRTESRWPQFAQRAVQAGVQSMLSFQLYVQDDNLGALNLFSRRPDAFTDESEAIGLIFASHAAVAYADQQQLAQLRTALNTRELVGQAMGILMERYQLDRGRAFRVLTRYSQNSNRKLVDIAEQLVTTRSLPGSTEIDAR